MVPFTQGQEIIAGHRLVPTLKSALDLMRSVVSDAAAPAPVDVT
jgi:hypothetical protein